MTGLWQTPLSPAVTDGETETDDMTGLWKTPPSSAVTDGETVAEDGNVPVVFGMNKLAYILWEEQLLLVKKCL